MPTPFTHLEIAQRLLKDEQVSPAIRSLLDAERSAFLLGNIAADARVSSNISRADTHFYRYDDLMREHPWRVMMANHPTLEHAHDNAHRAFLAGYVAHLTVDEIWTKDMLRAWFFDRSWGPDDRFRFLMLNVLLIYMDERDYGLLEGWHADSLTTAQPNEWLPFMGRDDLNAWRDFIAIQLTRGSQTLAVLGARIKRSPEELRALLDSPERLQADLWDHVAPEVLAQVEDNMYAACRDEMLVYLEEFSVYSNPLSDTTRQE
jgi:hypothetical protein